MTATADKNARDKLRRDTRIANGCCPVCGVELSPEEKEAGYKTCTICRGLRRDYRKVENKRLKAAGLCVQCRKPIEPGRAGRIYCLECQAKHNEYNRTYGKQHDDRDRGIRCLNCHKPLPYNDILHGACTCESCRKVINRRYAAKLDMCLKNGLCVLCRGPVGQDRIGKSTCKTCCDRMTAQRKVRDAKRRAGA